MGTLITTGGNFDRECSYLIKRLKEDIQRYGENTETPVWGEVYKGELIYTDYDLLPNGYTKEMWDDSQNNLEQNEVLQKIKLGDLLVKLEEQNKRHYELGGKL